MYDFRRTCPTPVATDQPTRYVVVGNGGSLFLADSYDAASALKHWLEVSTGQTSSIRPVLTYTLGGRK